MVFRNIYVLVLRTKVASALEGLKVPFDLRVQPPEIPQLSWSVVAESHCKLWPNYRDAPAWK